jgi:hypothetical protein
MSYRRVVCWVKNVCVVCCNTGVTKMLALRLELRTFAS